MVIFRPSPFALRLSPFLGFLLLWQVSAMLISSLMLPGPVAVFQRLAVLLLTGHLLADIGWTLFRVVIGVGAGFALGLALGFLLGHSQLGYRLLDPLLQLLRPISPFAWTPLVILVCGLGDRPAIVTILIGVVWPAIVIVFEAVRGIAPELRDLTRVAGATGWARIRLVELPLIGPQLLAALRVLFGVGWVLAVGAEMLAANSGLGFRLMNARYLLDFAELYALIVMIGVVGYVLDFILRRLEPSLG
jgi:NitT/TauT family transport system permease protein